MHAERGRPMAASTGTSAAGPSAERRDFSKLRKTGERPGTSWAIGYTFSKARDRIARFLSWLGVTPNVITVTGLVLTCGAAVCLAMGGSHTLGRVEGLPSSLWCFAAFCLLFGAGACDILDGAVARLGGASTRFGQVLDSALDRFSDCVPYLGLIVHFAWIGNVTICALAGIALIHTYSISYIKARSDSLIDLGRVGWWQRGERCVAFLTGTLFGHMPALMWQQAILPFFTVTFRLRHSSAVIRAEEQGLEPPDGGPLPGVWRYLAPWRHARGSLPFDSMAIVNIAWLIAAPWIWPFFYGRSDPLRALMDRWLV